MPPARTKGLRLCLPFIASEALGIEYNKAAKLVVAVRIQPTVLLQSAQLAQPPVLCQQAKLLPIRLC